MYQEALTQHALLVHELGLLELQCLKMLKLLIALLPEIPFVVGGTRNQKLEPSDPQQVLFHGTTPPQIYIKMKTIPG